MKGVLRSLALWGCFLLLVAATAAASENSKLGFGFQDGLAAGKDFAVGQLIVGIREGMNASGIESSAATFGGMKVKEIPGEAVLIQFPSEAHALKAVSLLMRQPGVAFVERNGFKHIPTPPATTSRKGKGAAQAGAEEGANIGIESVSTDPGVGYQWHHTVIRDTAALGTLSATPPTVAVIDTGVDYLHPDLSGKVILGKNFVENNTVPYDDNGHGTHVAGIIAAKAANGSYGQGVCPNCKILAVKVLDSFGSGYDFDVAAGMAYARTAVTTPPTKVINMSLGGSQSTLISNEVAALKSAGRVLVAAAGNDYTADTTYAYPGADPNTALRVMATDQNDCRTFFSNFSPAGTPAQYNIAAPGWNINSTLPSAGFGPMSGTSMASPVVAGAAALVWGQVPSLTRDTLVTRIVNNAKSISCGFPAAARRLDVRKAVLATAETAVIGRLVDPFSGLAALPTATTSLMSGATQLSSDAANAAGFYEMTGLAAGTARTLKTSGTGYVNASQLRSGIAITSGLVAGPFTDAYPKARPAGDLSVVVDWKSVQPNDYWNYYATTGCPNCFAWDFDLLVRTPGGTIIAPWNNLDGSFMQGSLTASPYAMNPRDSANDLEPVETVVISKAAADGIYKIVVDNWDFGYGSYYNPAWTGSGAAAQFFNGASPIGVLYKVPSTCTAEYWYVGNFKKSGSTYTWTAKNTCTGTLP